MVIIAFAGHGVIIIIIIINSVAEEPHCLYRSM